MERTLLAAAVVVVGLAGVGLIAGGLWWLHPAAGLIGGGAACVFCAWRGVVAGHEGRKE